jgi:hypothetical protein
VDQCLQWFRWLETQPGRRACVDDHETMRSGTFEEDTH